MGRCTSKFYIDKTKSKENGYINFEGGIGISGTSSSIGLMNLNEGGSVARNPYRNRIINSPEHKMLSYNGFSHLPMSIVINNRHKLKKSKRYNK